MKESRPPTRRQVRAGLNMLAGMPDGKAMLAAGYAPSVARRPKEAGADRCVRAALEAHPDLAPSKLVEDARRALSRKLSTILDSPSKLEKTRLSEIAKTVDILERNHGGKVDSHGTLDARRLGERLAWLQDVVEAYRKAKETNELRGGGGLIDAE